MGSKYPVKVISKVLLISDWIFTSQIKEKSRLKFWSLNRRDETYETPNN